MLKNPNVQNIENYQKSVERLWTNLEKPMVSKLKRFLGAQYLDIAKHIEQGDNNLNPVIDKHVQRLRTILLIQYKRVIATGFRNTKLMLEGDKKALTMEEEFQKAFAVFVQKYLSKKVTYVQQTTKEAIRDTVQQGLNEGLSNNEIAKKIRVIKEIATMYRAKMIARTETHGSYNYATDAAVKSTSVKYDKIWATNIDNRTRDPHIAANGQKVGPDAPFIVGGENMMYPGDPNGSGWNVIHCRCVLLYERSKVVEMNKPEGEIPQTIAPVIPDKVDD